MERLWRDRDLPELDRARSLLAADVAAADVDDLDALVDLLNEPLAVLPRLAGERLRLVGGVVVAEDVAGQRLRRCGHGAAGLMADADTASTGRATCVDCEAVVVKLEDVAALARDLEGCALFRGPTLPWPSSWLRIDERRVERRVDHRGERPIRVGGGPLDDVVNAGLPAGALALHVIDDAIDVRCADGLLAVAAPPTWAPRDRPRPASDVVALARADLRAPLVTELHVFRAHDPALRSVSVSVDAADPFALEVLWRGFSAREVLRVGEALPLSFDGSLRVLRTGSQVVVHTVGRAPWLIDLPPGERVDLPLGAATAVWRGRQLEVAGCPPPPARAPQVNLLVSHVAARRP